MAAIVSDGRTTGGAGSGPPLLAMRGITKHYPGVLANDTIDLELHAGEIVGLLGENGAGKTTLMKVLFGLERPDADGSSWTARPVSFAGPARRARARASGWCTSTSCSCRT